MKYTACMNANEMEIRIEKEGIYTGPSFLDYAEISGIRPINHRIFLDLLNGETAEISMLGFSFDGFYEELLQCFGERSKEALFVEEELIMQCEGEYALPEDSEGAKEAGRCLIALYPDAVCILPQTSHAVRIPLAFTAGIDRQGYCLYLTMQSGDVYMVGKMGYDTEAFEERCRRQTEKTKKKRAQLTAQIALQEPFTQKGLFRTRDEENYWQAAYGGGGCAVELFTDEKTATYLYRAEEPDRFAHALEVAMEAVGTHREIIFMEEGELLKNPLYRMCVHRSKAVRFLRSLSEGRIIHTQSHAQKLNEFLS